MNIWIMRHGEAGFNASSDAARTLTENGTQSAIEQGKWLGDYLNNNQIKLDKILVSPYLRAKQTLESLIVGMQAVNFCQNFATITEEWEEITPNGNPHTIENYLDFLKSEGAKYILIVSHLPVVYDLTQILTHHQANVAFPTATIAQISWAREQAEVVKIQHA
ncbi:TPA: phosphohistidine phosphatase SixA [Mannheimia haemolytica]